MVIEIREVVTKSDMKQFVSLQFELYKNNKFWAPPLKKGEIKYLDKNQNPAFEFADAKFYLAFKNDKLVGRIGAIVNKKYNEKTGINYVRFTKPEFIDDLEVSTALINKVIEFGKQNKADTIHGPLGFSNLDTQGLLVEGFDELQSVASVYHLPYYKEHFEKMGFEKENDWVECQLKLTKEPIEKATRGAALVKKRYGFETLNFQSTKEMKIHAPVVFDILNEAFADLPYVTPFEPKLKQFYIDKYFDILNPKFVKAVTKDNELVGFIIAVPSMSKAMQKANGKLSLGGILALMKARKVNDMVDLFLTGVVKKYQNAGVAVILISEVQNALHDNGMDVFETTGVFETNKEVLSNWKNYEHKLHKRRRCYVKKI